MRLNLKHYIVALASIVAFASCEKNETINYDGPALAHFAGISTDGLYIQDTKTPIDTIWVGVTVKADVERTIPYTVIADGTTAVVGTHYEILTPKVVVPANSSLGYIAVKGNYANLKAHYAVADAKDLNIKIELNNGGDVNLAQFNTSIVAGVFDYMPFIPSEWNADYDVDVYSTTAAFVESYSTSLTLVEGKTFNIAKLGDFENVKLVIDDSNPAVFRAIFDDFSGGVHSTYGEITIKPISNYSNLSVKKNQIEVYFQKTVSAGYFYKRVAVFTKK